MRHRWLAAAFCMLPLDASADSPETCEAAAKKLLVRVEKAPMEGRAAMIASAFMSDRALGCGVLAENLWSSAVALPEGCRLDQAERCRFDGGLEVETRAARDAGLERYVRIQNVAMALRKVGKLSALHERLLSTWILSAALEGEARQKSK